MIIFFFNLCDCLVRWFITGFDLEDLLVDLYYWFEKKVQKEKNEFQSFAVFVTWSIVRL